MKATLLTANLQKKLPFLQRAVASRSELPILLNFLIVAKDNTLHISATDLEIGITTTIPASIEQEGEVAIPAKIFSDFLLNIGADKVTLETVETSLRISATNVHATLQTMEASDFPKLYEEKGELLLKEERGVLEGILSCVVFAASIDSQRPGLSGVLLKKQQSDVNGFLFVATDGYRLSLKTQTTKKEEKKETLEKPLLIPARIIKELLSLKTGGEDVEVYISQRSNQVIFIQEDTVLIGRLIEAEYPNYERIIPHTFATKVYFDRVQMQKAVKICSIFARETANIVKLSIMKDKVIISANTPSVGEDSVDVDAKIEGEENEIAFNGRYLLDLLNNITEDQLLLEINGPLNPGVFKIQDDLSFLHIIMPIRVQA